MPNLEHPVLRREGGAPGALRLDQQAGDHRRIYYGVPKPTESFAPQESWAYNPNLPKQEYDLAKANKILDEAGWKRGFAACARRTACRSNSRSRPRRAPRCASSASS
jgi:peptide/nickel transport system substrate-binding protein